MDSPPILPNAHLAEIDPLKLHGYLLSTTHEVGQFKARFFMALGYRATEWLALEADLRIQHLTQPAEPGPTNLVGRTFTIRAILTGSNGRSANVISVWLVRAASGIPHFVTAYPGGDR